jgi:hypothetical protein
MKTLTGAMVLGFAFSLTVQAAEFDYAAFEQEMDFLRRRLVTACPSADSRDRIDPAHADTARSTGEVITARLGTIRARIREVNVALSDPASTTRDEIRRGQEALAQAQSELTIEQERYKNVLADRKPASVVETARQRLLAARQNVETRERALTEVRPTAGPEQALGELEALTALNDRYARLNDDATTCVAKTSGAYYLNPRMAHGIEGIGPGRDAGKPYQAFPWEAPSSTGGAAAN